MMPRFTAIVYILLANIILMAPIVVPHHHHEEKVCIENTHCPTEEDTHQQNIPEHEHEHDGENSSEFCSLKQVVVLPSNQVIQKFKIVKSKDNLTAFNDSQTLLIDPLSPRCDVNFVPKFLSSLRTSTCRLRGPPTA